MGIWDQAKNSAKKTIKAAENKSNNKTSNSSSVEQPKNIEEEKKDLFVKAKKLYDEEKYKLAIPIFDEAIKFSEKLCKLNNKNDLYFYQLAYAYELSNNNILAIEN